MTTPALLPIVEVRCVFCPHIEQALDPYTAGDQMEQHYAKRHQQRIDALTGHISPAADETTAGGAR